MVNAQVESHKAAGFGFPIFCNYCTLRPPNVPLINRRGLRIKVRGEIKRISNIPISGLKLKMRESKYVRKTSSYGKVTETLSGRILHDNVKKGWGESQEAAQGAGRGLFCGSSSPMDLLATPRHLGDEQTATQIEINKHARITTQPILCRERTWARIAPFHSMANTNHAKRLAGANNPGDLERARSANQRLRKDPTSHGPFTWHG